MNSRLITIMSVLVVSAWCRKKAQCKVITSPFSSHISFLLVLFKYSRLFMKYIDSRFWLHQIFKHRFYLLEYKIKNLIEKKAQTF